jgi:CBS domain-containing protein
MTSPVRSIREDSPVREAVEVMRTDRIGVLPVVRGEKLVGLVTDRDLVVRAFGRAPEEDLRVRDVMTRELEVTSLDEPLDEVAERMRVQMIQRLPVVDRAGYLLGIVSLDDLALRSEDPHDVRRTMASFAERGPAETPRGWEPADESRAFQGSPPRRAGALSFGRRESGAWQREPLTAREVMRTPAKSVRLGTPLREVVSIMTQENVGVLPVVDQDEKLKGVITDRDVLVRASAKPDGQELPVDSVMTTDLQTVQPDEAMRGVIDKMSRRAIHRLPVVNEEGRLVGIVSIDDVAQRADYDEEVRDALAHMAGRRSFWRRLATFNA